MQSPISNIVEAAALFLVSLILNLSFYFCIIWSLILVHMFSDQFHAETKVSKFKIINSILLVSQPWWSPKNESQIKVLRLKKKVKTFENLLKNKEYLRFFFRFQISVSNSRFLFKIQEIAVSSINLKPELRAINEYKNNDQTFEHSKKESRTGRCRNKTSI